MEADTRAAYLEKLSALSTGTFWDHLGCELERCDEQQVVVSLVIQPHHQNLIGIVHGGVYAGIMDSAMGLIAMMAKPQARVVTTNLNMNYVASVTQGRLIVTAKALHLSGRMITTECYARKESGELCAFSTGTFRVLDIQN